MLDASLRPLKDRLLSPVAVRLAAAVSPAMLTGTALTVGLAAAVAASAGWFWLALVLWLANRIADGLDGLVARQRGSASDLGGYLDMMGDTAVYLAIPLGVAAGAEQANLWPATAALLGSFYLNVVSWAYLAALLHKRSTGSETPSPTSIVMPAGLVEGTETVAIYAVFLAVPALARPLFWAMAGLVVFTALQRIVWARRHLPAAPPSERPGRLPGQSR